MSDNRMGPTGPRHPFGSGSSLSISVHHGLADSRHAVDVLRRAALAAPTTALYHAAVVAYTEFCRSRPPHRHHRLPHPSAALDLDDCVQLYIGHLYAAHDGKQRHRAVNTVYGIYAVDPHLRHQLRRSEQLLAGWTRLTPALSHPPLTWPLVTLLACTMAKSGYHGCALATVIGFHALLRVGELAAIRVADVSLPTDARRGLHVPTGPNAITGSSRPTRVCIRLAVTKTGDNQWVELYDDHVAAFVARLAVGRLPGAPLFTLECGPSVRARADYYRAVLRAATTVCGLSHCRYTPHSLRHGGATYAHLVLDHSIETIMHRGRWRSNQSCRTYIQSGAAHLLQLQHPAVTTRLAEAAHAHWEALLLRHCFSGPAQSR
jgi:integrase